MRHHRGRGRSSTRHGLPRFCALLLWQHSVHVASSRKVHRKQSSTSFLQAPPNSSTTPEPSALYSKLASIILGSRHSPYDGFLPPMDMRADMWYRGSLTYHRDLALEIVRHAGASGYIIEFGSFIGNSALAWARAIKRLEYSTVVVCVDTWLGEANFWRSKGKLLGPQGADGQPRLFEAFMLNTRTRTRNASRYLLPVRMAADSALRYFAELVAKKGLPRPAAIYVDTAHTYPETVLELRSAYALLPPGGFLVGDDFRGDWAEVQQSVNEFVSWAGPSAFDLPITYVRSWPYRQMRVVTLLDGAAATTGIDDSPLLVRLPGQWVLRKASVPTQSGDKHTSDAQTAAAWTHAHMKPLQCCLNGWLDHPPISGGLIGGGSGPRYYTRCAPRAPYLSQGHCSNPAKIIRCEKEKLVRFGCHQPVWATSSSRLGNLSNTSNL